MGQRLRAIARATPEAAKAGVPRSARRTRAALYATTALQAAALLVAGLPARAQPAANARPAGGQVSSGSAAITSNATTTLVRQSSQNAVVNWQNFNIGSAQTVQYAQPGASSFTLNRVISANPSQIAGHILANGRIAIVNQSGVVFLQGSTVDTAGLVVSAAGITDQDFMAGRLVFVQPPQPGAVVSNAGNITVRQAGLAALVAPQVANSGTITAVLGRVVLGGAATHTLDMYGDGLVALNVTGQVTQVQLGGRTVTALVTNTGTILAPGGTVVLTAQAADGVVSKLISASGTISAPTLGGQSGRVLVSGVGGDIEVDGAIQATGASGAGGSVTVTGNRNVTVASGGVLDASGAYGGGAVKLLAPTGNVTVAPGAALRARGTLRGGRGGRITVQAGGTAGVHGTLDASGATTRDAGGTLAVSGGTLSVDGLLSANLPGQPTGHAAFTDKGSLTVQFATCAMGANCLDFASFLNDLSTIVDTDGAITFVAGKNAAQSKLTSAANISLTTVLSAPGAASGDIIFDSGTSLFAPDFLVHAAGNIDIYGLLSGLAGTPATSVTLTAGGDINEHNPAPMPATSGTIDAQALIVSARNVVLDTASNSITTLGSVTAAGNFTLDDASGLSVTAPLMAGGDVAISVTGPSHALTISSAVSGVNVTFDTGSLSLLSDASVSALGSFTAVGNVTEGAQATIHANTLAQITGTLTQTGGTFSAGTLTIGGDVIQAGGILSAGSLATIGGSLAQTASSTLTAGTLSLGAMGQAVSLTQDGGSAIILGEGGGTIQLSGSLDQGVLSHITAQGGTLSLIANGGLTLAGLVSDQTGTVDLLAQGGGISQSGTMGLTGTLLAGTLALQAGTIGGAAFDVHLDNVAVNHIEVLSDASVSGNLTLADNDPIALMAKATVTVGGTLALSTSLLSMSGGGSITASSFALTGNLAQQTGDSLTASGQASVDGSLSQIGGSLSGGTVTIAGGVQQSAGGSLGAVGALTIDGSVAQNASTISAGGSAVIRGASFLQNGSTLSAAMLSVQSGTFSQSNDGQGASSAIDVGAGGTTIALTGNLTQDAGSSIVSGGTLSLTGNTLLLAGLVSDSQGTVMLGGPATQLITETASGAGSATGSLQAGTLVAQAAGGIRLDTVSGPGVGNAIVDLGRISAGPTFALADGVAVTLNGTLSASSVALRAPSLTVSAGAAIDAQPPAGAGAISIGADRISLVGTLSAPAGLVAIGLLHPGTFSVVAGGTIDPTSLEHVFTGPVGTIALGSTNGSLANGMGANLTWDAASTGAVSTLSVLGAIDLSTAANAGTLGLFSNGGVEVNVGAPSNGVTVATLYGAAAGDFLAASSQNLIQAIGPTLTAQGGTLVLTDAGTLTLLHGARVAGNNGVTLSALGGTLTQDSLSAIDSASGMVELDSAPAGAARRQHLRGVRVRIQQRGPGYRIQHRRRYCHARHQRHRFPVAVERFLNRGDRPALGHPVRRPDAKRRQQTYGAVRRYQPGQLGRVAAAGRTSSRTRRRGEPARGGWKHRAKRIRQFANRHAAGRHLDRPVRHGWRAGVRPAAEWDDR